ncbi:agmatinase [Candidatus Planktophila lacus]|uniref:agmatinase n=1 Tax=Candidatus Planktophila lacus TaxID=1884913 RepID=UPI000BACBCF9|nr:agmatinase [Candidatus Planktophila lacus]ASY25267.1 agmatinase [Candidatus Planktophila lacus]
MANHGNMYGPSFTFLGIQQCDLDDPKSYADADVIIVGAPIDSGTSHRSGTKFGPQAIRGGDYLPHDAERPHLALRIDALKALKVYDAGDLLMPPGDLVSSLKVLEEATEKISRAGKIPVILGGDHSIASADVAGIAKHRGLGKISMIHFDAHADTGEDQFGALIGHGTPMRRLIESGQVRGDRFLQLGLRGYWPDDKTLNWMRDQGMRSYEMTEIHHRGLNKVLDESFATLTDGCDGVFLSVDIDVVDPGMAPGTGTPEPGGMTSRELLEAVRRICLELPVVGIDVVEVAPPFDSADITAILANRVVLEALSAIAKRRSGTPYSPTQNLLDR